MRVFLRYVFAVFIALILVSCGQGSCNTNNSNLIYNFNNGAGLYGETNLEMNQGNSVEAKYTLSGHVGESFAVILSTDNPLLNVKVATTKQLQSNTSCNLCGLFTPNIVELTKYLSESNSTLIISSAANLAPGTYILNLYADGVNGTNFPHTQIGKITIVVVEGILTASPSRVDLDNTNATQAITLFNNGRSTITDLNLPTVSTPLSLESTSCVAGQSLLAGESCVYNVAYQSTQESGNQVLTFTYNDGAAKQSTSVNVTWAAYFKFWTLITGGAGQPTGVNEVYGIPTTSKILVSSADGFLWTYVNKVWTKILTGTNGTPDAYGSVVGFATVESLLYNQNNTLWAYQNNTWTQLASGATATVGAPSGNISVSENSTPDMIVGLDYSDTQVWTYKNTVWTKITGGNNQPESLVMISKLAPTTDDIVGYGSDGKIWQYHNGAWTQIGNGTTPPNPDASTQGGIFYGISTVSSVIFTPTQSDLWVYNSSTWGHYSGNGVNNSPTNVQAVYGIPTNNSLIIRDGHAASSPDWNQYYIWTYLDGTWTQITNGNGISAPQYGWQVYGETATPNHLFMTDGQDNTTANLWEWYQNAWTKLTGQTNGPTSVGFVGGNPTHNSFVMSDGDINSNYNTQLWTYVSGTWANITGHIDEPNGVQGIYGLVNPDAIVITANPHRDGLQGKGAMELWVGKR